MEINEREIMEYYGLNGFMGKTRMKMKFLRSWMLHTMAYFSPHSGLIASI